MDDNVSVAVDFADRGAQISRRQRAQPIDRGVDIEFGAVTADKSEFNGNASRRFDTGSQNDACVIESSANNTTKAYRINAR
ncbi:hypothetical protein [Actinoplanes sp. NPDC048796]|uniref:hypothetical protein n=1 Tax=unclassified Actinoplanes TaxID=2626549 RepID=UPI0033E465B5